MQRSKRWGCALLTAVLWFAAPASVAMAEPEPPVPQANWGSCDQFFGGDVGLLTAQCTMLAVPRSYDDPDGATVDLAVIRVPAAGERIGALFVNPGGPGASAVDTVAGMAAALVGSPINEHFDFVGFDPRGVGHSTPELRCRTDAEFDAWRREPMVDFSPAGVAHIESLYQQFAQQCATRMGTDFLSAMGTREAAHDMETIRRVLGDEKINYLGFSYGTEIGTAYVSRYGQHVRAMVLDGAVDPSIDPVTKSINQMGAFQRAFTDYAADCAQTAGCPLGQDPSQWIDRYHQLINPLVAKPAYTSDPRGLSYADAITGTFNALYTQHLWKYLTSGLLGLARGTDAGDLLLLADEYQGRDSSGHYRNVQDTFHAVRCVDAPSPTDPAVWAAADQRIREVAPFAAYGEFTGYAPRDICAFWPVPATSAPHEAPPAPPGSVVVVSTTHDPATPYEAGVSLARQLQAPLISFEGTQHTVVFNGFECIDSAIVDYLVDGVVPGNLQCAA
ncbi:hydrolase [Mycobacterium sp. ACS4331]|nr:hydrolase [Mycobacterium sp. ACS4331]